jgi:hypothetical protein
VDTSIIATKTLYKERYLYIYIRETDTDPGAMASTHVIRVTLFKIPKEEDRAEMTECYKEMSANATKVSSFQKSAPFAVHFTLG